MKGGGGLRRSEKGGLGALGSALGRGWECSGGSEGRPGISGRAFESFWEVILGFRRQFSNAWEVFFFHFFNEIDNQTHDAHRFRAARLVIRLGGTTVTGRETSGITDFVGSSAGSPVTPLRVRFESPTSTVAPWWLANSSRAFSTFVVGALPVPSALLAFPLTRFGPPCVGTGSPVEVSSTRRELRV